MAKFFIDSHAHLDFPDYDEDLAEVIARAAEEGVSSILTVGTDLEASEKCLGIAAKYEGIEASVGIHPHDAATASKSALETLKSLAGRGAVALGEMGLDFFRDRSPRDAQKAAFLAQLELASEMDLPVIIHSRESWEETYSILKDSSPPRRGVVHCFSGGEKEATEALSLGFYLSFAGPLTYPKADRARSAAALVPIEKILLETDSPFLAPQTIRGKRNEPAHVVDVARAQARLHHAELADTAAVTSLNARTLFGLGPKIPANKIAYPIRDSLYLNVTNRCTARCTFCRRLTDPVVAGHDLELPAEPTAEEVTHAVAGADPGRYREAVFCGYGEPAIRLDVILHVGADLRRKGHRVRLNTNGTANLIHERDTTTDLSKAVDELSVSLNAQDARTYNRLCKPDFGKKTYDGVLDFVKLARDKFSKITLTAVEGPEGVDMDACKAIADSLGVGFRARGYTGSD
ncbi:MAG: TatD family hydrolase [Planctomycetota bacterium]|jgi:TatD DNase family protein